MTSFKELPEGAAQWNPLTSLSIITEHEGGVLALLCDSPCLFSGSHVAQACLELAVCSRIILWFLLLPPRKCWNYRYTPPYTHTHTRIYPFYVVLGIEPRVLCILGKCSTNWATVPGKGWTCKFDQPFRPLSVLSHTCSPAILLCSN